MSVSQTETPSDRIASRRERLRRVDALVEELNAIDTDAMRRLAERAGVPERMLWRYRAGETVPNVERLLDLERHLGLRSGAGPGHGRA